MNKKILFSSGGTGGHMFPTVSVMKYLFKKNYSVVLCTDLRGSRYLEKNLNFKSYILKIETPFKKNFFIKLLILLKILISIIKSIFILKKENPNLIFGFGGYLSFPICVASRILNIPIILYENNLILGRANKYLLPFAKKLLIGTSAIYGFKKKHHNKIYSVGNILREDILNYPNVIKKKINNPLTILILGGSQGAKIFGNVIPEVMKKIKDSGKKIIVYQQCKENQKSSLIDFYKTNNIEHVVFKFRRNILDLLFKSDLAISRCGASTTAELAYTQTPFIAVPYPSALDNHQYLNAKYYEKKKYCWILEQKSFDSNTLFNLIIKIVQDKNTLEVVRSKMKKNNDNETFGNIEKIIEAII